MASSFQPKVALVIGAGDATGAAIARRFAKEGYIACVTRRDAKKLTSLVKSIEDAGGKAYCFGSDARKEEQVIALVDQIECDIGPIEVLAFNIGANVSCSILEETARKYFKIWEMACFKRFSERPRSCKAYGRSWPWNDPFHRCDGRIAWFGEFCGICRCQACASRTCAEHGARAWPKEHPCRAWVVDGAIDTDFIRTSFPERYALKSQDGILNPDHIAENYWYLHKQPRDAWTFEIDLRPYLETW